MTDCFSNFFGYAANDSSPLPALTVRQRIPLPQAEGGAAVAEHKIDDLRGGGQRQEQGYSR